jgi:hypothetical protein
LLTLAGDSGGDFRATKAAERTWDSANATGEAQERRLGAVFDHSIKLEVDGARITPVAASALGDGRCGETSTTILLGLPRQLSMPALPATRTPTMPSL